MKNFKALLFVAVVVAGTAVWAASPERYLHIKVNNPKTEELVRVNVPLSLYVGRIPLSHAPAQLALQLFWCAVLAIVTRFMWQRASHRVTVQGG